MLLTENSRLSLLVINYKNINDFLACQCNGQANSCNQETGDCHCFTYGVIGAHCDKCEQKYDGNPAEGKPCICNFLFVFKFFLFFLGQLYIDYIFTFKLDGEVLKDKYVTQVIFYSIPIKVFIYQLKYLTHFFYLI